MNKKKKSKYQLVIFDWDGTVIDSHGYICQCFYMAAENLNLPVPTEEEIRPLIGLSLEGAVERLFANETTKSKKAIITEYQNSFYKLDKSKRVLFTGARETIESLNKAGYWLAVATGKSKRGLAEELEEHHLNDYFLLTRTAEETKCKPNPLMLEEILAETGLNANEAVMVGDTDHDILMAQAINMDTVLAAYGNPDDDYIQSLETSGKIDTISELIPWLENK